MSELWKYPKHEKRFLDAFPSEYNRVHGTNFSGVVERPGKIERGWDYRWPDPVIRRSWLEVQHTVAASNAYVERVHRQGAATFNSGVCRHLKACGSRGLIVSIKVADTPKSPKDLQIAIEFICDEIDKAVAAGIPIGKTARGSVPWRAGKQESKIEIGVHNRGGHFQSSSILTPTPRGFFENVRWRLSKAVQLKAEQIGRARTEVALVVDFDINGFDYEDVDVMLNELDGEDIPFREVWAVDLGQNAKLVRVWSRASVGQAGGT